MKGPISPPETDMTPRIPDTSKITKLLDSAQTSPVISFSNEPSIRVLIRPILSAWVVRTNDINTSPKTIPDCMLLIQKLSFSLQERCLMKTTANIPQENILSARVRKSRKKSLNFSLQLKAMIAIYLQYQINQQCANIVNFINQVRQFILNNALIIENKQNQFMYTGFKPNQSTTKSIISVDPTQTQLQSLQREVDNYTRKLEQEKRKFFSIQDTLKNVNEDYDKQKTKLNQLKKQNSKAHNVMLQAKVKNLEANLDKAISTYNDTVAHNNKLKADIDMLRREKKNYIEMFHSLEEQIKKHETESQQKLALIEKKKNRAEQLKNEIIKIKSKNQEERDQYIKQFDSLQKEYISQKRDKDTLKLQKNAKPQSIDTQPLLKQRLKKIVTANKQKLKMIEQYKKHMKQIQQAFNDIKQKSGINTLQEITNTFIKSEEQNYSLYNYMDQLARNIDNLQEENRNLQRKIQQSKSLNEEKKNMLTNMSQEQKNKAEIQSYLKKKEEGLAELHDLVQKIKPTLSETLISLAKSKFNDDPKKVDDYLISMNINDRNIEEYLSDLERYISILMMVKQQNKIKGVVSVKQSSTNYSKPLPQISIEEINREKQGRDDNKFIDHEKFREYANEYWQKKKLKAKDN